MEPRSEDDQFEEVTVQQLPQVKHAHPWTSIFVRTLIDIIHFPAPHPTVASPSP